MKNKIHIISLGCPKNLIDSEVMAAALIESGCEFVYLPEDADTIIINTCAFILPAKEESIDEILRMAELKRTGLCRYLIVAGCLPQRYGDMLEKEIPEVDLFLGTGMIPRIVDLVASLRRRAIEAAFLHRETRFSYELFPFASVIDATAHRVSENRGGMFQPLFLLCDTGHPGEIQKQACG